jgi:hypothetical protein
MEEALDAPQEIEALFLELRLSGRRRGERSLELLRRDPSLR